jgi:DNA-binding CsgD family transcriptional regulator
MALSEDDERQILAAPGPKKLDLTEREAQIRRMLGLGHSNQEIADRLCMAVDTVKNQCTAC